MSVDKRKADRSSIAKCDQNGKCRRIVQAPMPSQPLLPSPVLDVECAENEEVVWHYTVTLEGQFVSGYSIVPRFGNFMNPPVPKRRPIGFTADLSKKS